MPAPACTARDLVVRRGGRTILDDLSFAALVLVALLLASASMRRRTA